MTNYVTKTKEYEIDVTGEEVPVYTVRIRLDDVDLADDIITIVKEILDHVNNT